VLCEYLLELRSLPSEEEGEKARREVFEKCVLPSSFSVINSLTKPPFARYSCQELLAEMVHTKDGSLCVREFLAWGSAKDRKQILKVLKPHLERIWTNEEGQLVLFTALDVIECVPLVTHAEIGNERTPLATPSSSPSLSSPT
jgi:pumilio family protein 6